MSPNPPQARPWLTLVWLAWMLIMVQFSTALWSGSHTEAMLAWVLPSSPDTPMTDTAAPSLQTLNYGIRKTAHLSEYAVLALLSFAVCHLNWQRPRVQALFLALSGTALFALSDEFHQSFVASRTSAGTDVLIDITGATIALVGLACLTWRSAPTE